MMDISIEILLSWLMSISVLSATIGNIEYLIELFTKINNDNDLTNLREKENGRRVEE